MILKSIILYLFILLIFFLILPVKLIQQRYKFWGGVLFSLSFFICAKFIDFALFPLNLMPDLLEGSNSFLMPFVNGYQTYKFFSAYDSIFPFILFYLQYFFYSAAFVLCGIIINKKKSFLLPITINFLIATAAILNKMINTRLLADTGLYIIVLAGSVLGVVLGKLVYPYFAGYVNKYI